MTIPLLEERAAFDPLSVRIVSYCSAANDRFLACHSTLVERNAQSPGNPVRSETASRLIAAHAGLRVVLVGFPRPRCYRCYLPLVALLAPVRVHLLTAHLRAVYQGWPHSNSHADTA